MKTKYYYLIVILMSVTAVLIMNKIAPELSTKDLKWWVCLLSPTIIFGLIVKKDKK